MRRLLDRSASFRFALLASLLVSLFSGSRAQAQVLLFAGNNLSFEKANNERSIETRQPFAIRGGWGFKLADVLLEYSVFNVSQGTYAVHVNREHREWILWAKRGFMTGRSFNPYASLGGGFQSDEIETSLGRDSVKSEGLPLGLLACAGGVEARVFKGIELNLEGRLAMSEGYAPNPMPSFAFFIGYRY